MTQIALHLDQASIADDMEFYLTDRWDKHNQITPRDDIVNLTVDSENLIYKPGTVSNFLYPIPRNSFESIYIGPSLVLYSNQWGCAFLNQLLYLLEPEGMIILPVHPEGRAHEKGYWSRSALESTFRNRSGLTGVSNIRAENDGVMSMRVGRRWPRHFPSTIDWFFRERAALLLNQIVSGILQPESAGAAFAHYAKAFWNISSQSVVIERIIQDHFGVKVRGKTITHFGASNSLLTAELAVNEKLKFKAANVLLPDAERKSNCSVLALDFAHHTAGNLHILDSSSDRAGSETSDITVLINEGEDGLDSSLVQSAWSGTQSGGILIWLDDWNKSASRETMEALNGSSRYYEEHATVELNGHPQQRAYCVVQKP